MRIFDEFSHIVKNGFSRFRSAGESVSQLDLNKLEQRIMSVISDFASKMNAYNDQMDQAITGLQAEVQTLTGKIHDLQVSPGQVTPDDQVLLDQVEQRAQVISQKLNDLSNVEAPPAPSEPAAPTSSGPVTTPGGDNPPVAPEEEVPPVEAPLPGIDQGSTPEEPPSPTGTSGP